MLLFILSIAVYRIGVTEISTSGYGVKSDPVLRVSSYISRRWFPETGMCRLIVGGDDANFVETADPDFNTPADLIRSVTVLDQSPFVYNKQYPRWFRFRTPCLFFTVVTAIHSSSMSGLIPIPRR